MTTPVHVIVIGAGAAGLTTVRELRRLGFGGQITIIGDEDHLPYDRPPLSKQILSGHWSADQAALVDDEEWDRLDVSAHRGVTVTRLRIGPPGEVELADGRVLIGDAVVIATGCRASIPEDLASAAQVPGVHSLRTIEDALALRHELQDSGPLVVAGGGFLGLEVCASARSLGIEVTLLSRRPPLSSVLSPDLTRELCRAHEEMGTAVSVGVQVQDVEVDSDGHLDAVRVGDGSWTAARALLVATGGHPATGFVPAELLEEAGTVRCDDRGNAAPGIYACGDASSWWNPSLGSRVHTEHRLCAGEQATVVAQTLVGQDASWDALPFWWSDQGSIRLQGYGVTSSALTIHRLKTGDRRFVDLYLDEGTVVGALGWNSAKTLRTARAWIGHPLSSLPADI